MRLVWIVALVFTVAWIASAAWPRTPSTCALQYFDESFLAIAERRARLSYISAGFENAVFLLFLYLVMRYGQALAPAAGLTGGVIGQGVVLGLAVGTLVAAIGFPFRIYSGFYLERMFGLSRQTFLGWLGDYAKATGLNLVVYALGGGFVALLVSRAQGTWFYWLAFAFFLFSVFVAFIYPRVIAPLFNEFHPLRDEKVLQEVKDLSSKAGMQVSQVLVMEASKKTTRTNAYFAGLGRTKQVVLYDNLLDNHSLEEVRLVLAHELGHWRFGHVWKGILASTLGTLLMFGSFAALSGRLLPGNLPVRSSPDLVRFLLVLFVFVSLASYVLTPLGSFLSRQFEVQSDAFSLSVTGDPSSFVTVQVNLARTNLGDVEPPAFIRWFAWTHPTTLERIEMAKNPQWDAPSR